MSVFTVLTVLFESFGMSVLFHVSLSVGLAVGSMTMYSHVPSEWFA